MSSHRIASILLVVIALTFPAHAHGFGHYWSKGFGYSQGKTVTVDAAGNIILFAEYSFNIDLGGGPLPTADLYGNACLAKFDPSGGHIWSKSIAGFDAQFARFVRTDADGNVVIAGEFLFELDIDGNMQSTIGDVDIFLAKFDPSGNLLWSQNFGKTSNISSVSGLGVDDLGNIYMVSNGNQLDYGGGPLPLDADVDIVKFDPQGNHVWSDGYGHAFPANSAAPRSLTVDPAGNVLVTGDFSGTIDFGGATLTSVGDHDIFLARFDTGGSHLWSKSFGDAGDHVPQIVASDGAGNGYLAVALSGTIDFGGGSLSSAGLDDIFLAKFDADGNHLWAKRFGDGDSQGVSALWVSPGGGVHMAGFNPTGSFSFGGGSVLDDGSFLAKLSNDGIHITSQDFGSFCSPRAVAVDGWSNPIMTGEKNAATDFGGGPVAQIGSLDIFLAKFTKTATAAPDAATGSALGVNAFPNPFNPVTTVTYTVPEAGPVSIDVFDTAGRWVASIVENERRDAGRYTTTYRARGASGVYFVRITAGGRSVTKKVVLLK